MAVWENLEPQPVFHFFEEICSMPHGSGNTAQISAYLQKFAADRELWFRTDELGNVVMRKPASPGYEQVPGLIIQGHMDMVAVKTADCDKNMALEGLDVAVDGDYVYARNTSLGGDDGIAVAYGLAMMDDDSIAHPELELIVTVDEETGMYGVAALDMSDIRGRRFLNIDSEEEGSFLAGCAGGKRVKADLDRTLRETAGYRMRVTVDGLQGGHSGAEIHKERGNGILLLGRVLAGIAGQTEIGLINILGGTAENVIPSSASAEIVSQDPDCVRQAAEAVFEELKQEYELRDPGLRVTTEIDASMGRETWDSAAQTGNSNVQTMDMTEQTGTSTAQTAEKTALKEKGVYLADSPQATAHLIRLLTALPTGVQAMSPGVPGMVETSLNLGMISSDESAITFQYSIRSSLESAKNALSDKVSAIFSLAGARVEAGSDYPGWAYRVHSPLRDKMVRVYESMYGQPPQVTTIHAGLECGLFLGKRPDLDCVSMGPDMLDIHSVNEKLSISSTKRVWEFLLELLKDKS
ncbi:MAG: aminoacyl-histidine dipeptidase [Lachnospiraceae bacterium]|nr:aminoacyl-histidine dipeptidase [Lachnospiraceae bacterium]